MPKKLFVTLLLVFFAQLSFGQKMHISGYVKDTNGVALKNALATAVRVKDSLLLGFKRADENGHFVFDNLPMDTFMLTVSHPLYDDRSFYIIGNPENLTIDIPSIEMATKSKKLKEMVIYAYKDPVYFKGDTLVYIADSFKVGPNAVVEDLLKKLPGIEVDASGNIKSQGEEISKVLVDGDEFFGDDPTIATKNLGANAIESVQVYEKEAEGDFGSDEKIKVLDLKLKDDAKTGYFGKVAGASDFGLANKNKPFYEGELLFNHFKSKRKISVFALGTNTPRSKFDWGEISKFGLENEDASNSMFNPFGGNSPSGIPRTFKAGVYFSDKVGKKDNTKIGFNYTYYNNELQQYSGSRTQYFIEDTTYSTDDSTNNLARDESHIFNFTLESQLDSLTELKIEPSFRFDKNLTDNNTLTSYITEDGQSYLNSFANTKRESLGLNGSVNVELDRKFKKPRRELELGYYFNYVDNKNDGFLLTRSTSPLAPAINDTVDQSKKNYNSSMNNNFYTAYTEPIGKYFEGVILYNFNLGMINKDIETNDFFNGEYSQYRSDLSSKFETNRMEHKAGLKLQFKSGKHAAFIRLNARNVDILNDNIVTGNNIHQNVSNLLPSFMYTYKPSMSSRFRIRYNTYSDLPSIQDLQPVRNNSNPNSISIGNPNLLPSYSHSVNAFFNKWNVINGSYIWTGLNASYTDNDFSNSTTYDAFGRMQLQTINTNGNYNASVYGGGGIPLKGREIQFRPNALASFSHFNSYINNQENSTDNLMLSGGGDFNFQFDSLEFSFGGRYAWNNPKSSLNSASNKPYSVQTYSARVEWRMPLGFEIETNFDYTVNDQLASGYDLSYFIWNAEIRKRFLKTGNLIVALIGKDLLNQNVSAGRTVSGNRIVDNRTHIISRYFLLQVTMRFNNNKTREDAKKSMF